MRKLQHPVSDQLLSQIGDVTVSFAMLESQIQSFVWTLLTSDQRTGQIVTAELSFRNIRALLVSLYLERFGKDSNYGSFRSLTKRASEVEAKRNLITHSVWGAGGSEEVVIRIKTTAKEKHGLKFDFETVDVQKLKELALDIKVLASDFQQLLFKKYGNEA